MPQVQQGSPARSPIERNLLVFLAFVVILVILVGQGLSPPLLIRALGVGVDRGAAVLHLRERGEVNVQV